MALPTEFGRRRVVATNITDDGTPDGVPITGILTFEPSVRELIGRTSKVSVFPVVRRVPVTNGALSVDLIACDNPTVDAGLTAPWAYMVTRSWDERHPFYVMVPVGTGVPSDADAVNMTTLHVPSPPGGVAIVKGDKGDPGTPGAGGGGSGGLTPDPANPGYYLISSGSSLTPDPSNAGYYLIGA